jgi:hypothetical protein
MRILFNIAAALAVITATWAILSGDVERATFLVGLAIFNKLSALETGQ